MSLSRVFEDGQAYVALSRARSLATLRVLDFTSSCIRADSTVVEYYMTLKKSSSDYKYTYLRFLWENWCASVERTLCNHIFLLGAHKRCSHDMGGNSATTKIHARVVNSQ